MQNITLKAYISEKFLNSQNSHWGEISLLSDLEHLKQLTQQNSTISSNELLNSDPFQFVILSIEDQKNWPDELCHKIKCQKLILEHSSGSPLSFKLDQIHFHNCFFKNTNEIFQNQFLINLNESHISVQNKFHLNSAKMELFNDQIKNHENLIEKIKRETNELEKKKIALIESHKKDEILKNIVIKLHHKLSLFEIETILNQSIHKCSQAQWVKFVSQTKKIQFENEFETQLKVNFKSYQLIENELFFVGPLNSKFKKSDFNIFEKLTENILQILAYKKVTDEHERLKTIYFTAFNNAIQPFAIVDQDYNLIESNKNFNKFKGQKCYQVMFNKDHPCTQCKLGKQFEINPYILSQTYKVTSNKLNNSIENQDEYLNIYNDISDEKWIQNQLLNNATTNELGIITSSLAHELNNPLGGVISFLQLIELDSSNNTLLQQDLKEMLQASHRIKNLIDQMVAFAKVNINEDIKKFNILNYINQSLQFYNLIFKRNHIQISLQTQKDDLSSAEIIVEFSLKYFRDLLYLIFEESISEFTQNYKLQKIKIIKIHFEESQTKFNLLFDFNFSKLKNFDQDLMFSNLKHYMNQNKNFYLDHWHETETVRLNDSWLQLRLSFNKIA